MLEERKNIATENIPYFPSSSARESVEVVGQAAIQLFAHVSRETDLSDTIPSPPFPAPRNAPSPMRALTGKQSTWRLVGLVATRKRQITQRIKSGKIFTDGYVSARGLDDLHEKEGADNGGLGHYDDM